jgi:hypothetical protein
MATTNTTKRNSFSTIYLTTGLLAAGVAVIPRMLYGFSYAEPYDMYSRLSAILITITAVYGVYAVTTQRKTTRLFSAAMYTISSLIVLAVAFLLYGVIKDTIGATCTGFFGTPSSCATGEVLIVMFTVLHPYTLMALGILLLAALVGEFLPKLIKAKRVS